VAEEFVTGRNDVEALLAMLSEKFQLLVSDVRDRFVGRVCGVDVSELEVLGSGVAEDVLELGNRVSDFSHASDEAVKESFGADVWQIQAGWRLGLGVRNGCVSFIFSFHLLSPKRAPVIRFGEILTVETCKVRHDETLRFEAAQLLGFQARIRSVPGQLGNEFEGSLGQLLELLALLEVRDGHDAFPGSSNAMRILVSLDEADDELDGGRRILGPLRLGFLERDMVPRSEAFHQRIDHACLRWAAEVRLGALELLDDPLESVGMIAGLDGNRRIPRQAQIGRCFEGGRPSVLRRCDKKMERRALRLLEAGILGENVVRFEEFLHRLNLFAGDGNVGRVEPGSAILLGRVPKSVRIGGVHVFGDKIKERLRFWAGCGGHLGEGISIDPGDELGVSVGLVDERNQLVVRCEVI